MHFFITQYSRGIQTISVALLFFLPTGCTRKNAAVEPNLIRVLIDSSPTSLDPRQSIDAIGQRLELLAFRGLTSLDAELNPVPDLSEKWRFSRDGKTVTFSIRKGLRDHAGESIDAERIFRCVRNYLVQEPKSVHASAFTTFRDVAILNDEVVFTLHSADPYFLRNISVLRYFSLEGDTDQPCRAPKGNELLVTNGQYRVQPYRQHFERELRYHATASERDGGAPDLNFELVRDDTSRLFRLLSGDADVVLSSFSPTKVEWLVSGKNGFHMVDREGTSVSYLAFNLRDPILRLTPVRLAIAMAIDRESIVKNKIRGQASVASSFLLPSLPEAITPQKFKFDPQESERILDAAGFPRGKDGVRFRLHYKTATFQPVLEQGLIFREMLGKIGVALDMDPVEPSVFLASIRKGNFQIYMSRWSGVSDGSIYQRSLRTGARENRIGYSDPLMDRWIRDSLTELDLPKRKALLEKIQLRMLEELPYFPLWHWTNSLIHRDTIVPPAPTELSLSGSYFPLPKLRFQKDPAVDKR